MQRGADDDPVGRPVGVGEAVGGQPYGGPADGASRRPYRGQRRGEQASELVVVGDDRQVARDGQMALLAALYQRDRVGVGVYE